MLYEQETVARDLYAFLEAALVTSSPAPTLNVEGEGVHWRVDARLGARTIDVHCFHCSEVDDGLTLGLSANSHLRNGPVVPFRPSPKGTEYLVRFIERGQELAEGRTHRASQVADCLASWLTKDASLADVYEAFPFVDMNLRAHRAIADVVERRQQQLGSPHGPELVQGFGGDVGVELWVRGGERSFKLEPVCDPETGCTEGIGCALLLHETQLAKSSVVEASDAANLVHLWIDESLSLEELGGQVEALQLTPFAELFEQGDIAAWHWANVLAQAREEVDRGTPGVLAPYLPLLERISVHPTTRRFYSFTSLHHLCFSLCSHYPFLREGMPVLTPTADGYFVECEGESVEGDVEHVLEFIVTRLAAVSEPPFHGNADSTHGA